MVLDYSSFTCVGLCRDVVCIVFGNQTEQSGVGAGQKEEEEKNVGMNMKMSMRRKSARVQNENERRKRMQRISARNVRNAAGRSFWKILTVGKNIALHFATA